MDAYRQSLREESAYLEKTVAFIRKELEAGQENLHGRKKTLLAARKDMWENTAHFSGDFTRLTEMNQYLFEVNYQAAYYLNALKQVEKYKNIIDTPYFGRFDFSEEDRDGTESIYVGRCSVMDPATHDVYVYDWRAPISGIFYRYEPGKAAYGSPSGLINGEVLLKRQYEIRKSKLKYFFDCSLTINDKMLMDILGRNASPKMRSIVETIQREQDIIIRDTTSDLLVIQGVAGSGKTSVALHRVAFLLYHGLKSDLKHNNVVLFSPNAVFSKYISSVLPELGEENVEQATFENIALSAFQDRFTVETRSMQLESLINPGHSSRYDKRKQSIDFKGSRAFAKILDRLIRHYERRMIPFEDVYFNGIMLETRQRLKNRFLNNKIGTPMAKQLQWIENIIWEKIHPLQQKRRRIIEKIVMKREGHDLQIKSYSRLLSIKEARRLRKRLQKFTRVDYWNLYQTLFSRRDLFFKLSKGLQLPAGIEEIMSDTWEDIQKGQVRYEDCAPLLYLKLRIEGSGLFPEIKQVVIDEAQDYYPMHYEVFDLLFKGTRYTILGDIHQSIEKEADNTLYDDITEILQKPNTVKLFLNKGYRSSYQINNFTKRILAADQPCLPFERHGEEPEVLHKENEESINRAIAGDVEHFLGKGYETVAVLCKTRQQAQRVHSMLKDFIPASLIDNREGNLKKGVLVIPSYIAKGLEFDAVIVYGADRENYCSQLDRKLLYIACTRALHRLVLYHTGEKSPFIPV